MEPDQLKQEILERLRLEREVKYQLQKETETAPAAPKRFAWLESKLGILLIGAVVSGILIPGFQFTQETFKWMRQNRYNALTHRIDDMRASMKQLISAHALLSETYNLGMAVPEELAQRNAAKAEQYRARIRELRMQRIQQNGTFASTIFFFPAATQEGIRTAWNDYLQAADRLQYAVDRTVNLAASAGAKGDALDRALRQIEQQVPVCNQKYDAVLALLQAQIAEAENESARFQ